MQFHLSFQSVFHRRNSFGLISTYHWVYCMIFTFPAQAPQVTLLLRTGVDAVQIRVEMNAVDVHGRRDQTRAKFVLVIY